MEIQHRTLKGYVVSDKMDKTVVVEISRMIKHPKYKKYYNSRKKYKAHDPANEYHVGDKVVIRETRPISKDKRWIVVGKL
ncbi:MAG: 30S ribosomal protein S17 [Candidatus Yanofskybacteria bacterium RIFCSPHIGHO2_02_FULL_50_12]|uniref:Small ribosomal subunit protein uS17 n=1 Tax=Candidatus Yanofskybacteria bacterium RIFCSPHIGHO2_02_FULL_50_12 TaxID=1802685 RepID=A0A1F8FYK4_9BACT|nr:MAG: 30S ribosomal protein S17 [Candidatus Yanofskybacteria bacterium RIFCSPHIGHO2_02_FULL_50_12]